MDEHYCNSYYALVWSTTLNEDVIVRGERLDRNVVLPKGPTMLYGTNQNDVLIVRNIEYETIVEYDVMKTEQRVKFVEIVEEISIPRDIRIVVWYGSGELQLAQDAYKVVTPNDFEEMVRVASTHFEASCELTEPSEVETRGSLHRASIKLCNEALRQLAVCKQARGLRGSSNAITVQ